MSHNALHILPKKQPSVVGLRPNARRKDKSFLKIHSLYPRPRHPLHLFKVVKRRVEQSATIPPSASQPSRTSLFGGCTTGFDFFVIDNYIRYSKLIGQCNRTCIIRSCAGCPI